MTSTRSIKFLLVDDLDANLVALAGLLERPGLELLMARSGREALEILLEHEVALAFLDVQMPEMSGFELAELMRGTERTRDVPIIFLTAGTVDQKRRIRGYETGAVDFLPKPIDPEILLNKATTFFELAKRREELRESEARLRAANEELERKNAELAESGVQKDRFLAVLAHELRNPIAPVLTGLEMMVTADNCPKEIVDLAEMMRRQIGQMVHLINDLLDVSRINTGKIALRMERVDINEVVTEAMESARTFIDSRGHELSFVSENDSLAVEGDRHRLFQVVSNMLSNAAKYSPPNGKIDVKSGIDGDGNAYVTVRDNGEGISEENLPKIFEMFEQVDSSRQEGLGIGLTLVMNLMELHGGGVGATSEGLGKGSEFRIWLPALVQRKEEKPVILNRPENRQFAPAKVMVVDDGKSTADIIVMFLNLEGMETRVAYNGEEAVRVAREFKPEMIFMDLGMPKMDGYQAAEEIRKLDPDVIMIAVSGWGREEDKRRSKEAGFDGHAVKPVEPEDLRQFLSLIC
ncbi:response regulator [Haloferula chungangensis]|uniref:histidine kinase n=1 Tax=Haloferula chungangensis TaxID=1048331 RepID=A0ABW2L4M6_9BACT